MSAIEIVDGVPYLRVHRYQLPCGLEVVLHDDPTATEVAVHVHYRAGSSDERPERTGLAHLFEHLFKNSLNLAGRKHYELLREVGGSGNAGTGADATTYHAVVPPSALALVLWIESDRMGYWEPVIDQARLVQQIDVVRAERRQRYENAAYGQAGFAVAEALLPPGHPHRHRTIGLHEHIAAATLDDLIDWYRTWYVPANAVLAIAGPIDLDETRALVERYFGSFPVSQRPVRAVPTAPMPAASEITLRDPRAALARLQHAWLGPARGHADEPALAVLADVLPRPGVGPLWRRAVYDAPIAQRVAAHRNTSRVVGEMQLAVTLRSNASLDDARAVLTQVRDDVVAGLVDDAMVARTRVRAEAALLWPLQRVAHRAAELARAVAADDDAQGAARRMAQLRAVTAADVAAAAARWLMPAHRVELLTQPGA